eukprot:6041603-Pleurochrysis_carterae.AAC.2
MSAKTEANTGSDRLCRSTISGSDRLETAAGAAAGGSSCRVVLRRVGFGVCTIGVGGVKVLGVPLGE